MQNLVDTLIIGGGQAGLALSYHLLGQKREHVLLEKADCPASAWRDDRWDSFTLVTPNWTFRLPGAEYDGDEPDGFMPRQELVGRFDSYARHYGMPLQYGVQAESVEVNGSGYNVQTNQGTWQARNVVVATGLFQTPKIPPLQADLPPYILQLPCGKYRNPSALPDGAVLIIGSGQSGCQIAEELYQAGRKVYLCVGSAGRVPRRYRGRDTFAWLETIGFMDRPPEKLPSPRARFAANPHLSGKNGGHTLNLHQFHREGVVLLGRLSGAEDGKLILAPDLKTNLAKADEFEANALKMIDEYIDQKHIEVPPEKLPMLKDGYSAPEILSLDIEAAGITTVIWALGYNFNYRMVKLPVLDEYGFPRTQRGVTASPGLYFLGMPWLHTQKSGLLMGVGADAEYIAAHLQKRQ